ncbi:MAG: SDR family NAD(P)-dependent oxidoreductase [Candidatus Methanomethylophilaceae archaeon]|nr:SDR family NAD(P)-dependent oxidoreductase [Candidatus Methanomethylophilaceae archaeon]
MTSVAIITGASSGMGAEFCKRLDAYNLDSIWLIARRKDKLDEVASSLKTANRIITADLTDPSQIASIKALIDSEAPDIRYLVNCAGFGKFGMTWELSPELTKSMIDLNVTALVQMTSICIPHMREGSHIIELDSLSAYVPLYDLNVYASTKAFVRHFCSGLRAELEDRKVSVTEVSPGWVRTEFIDISVTESNVPAKVFNNSVSKEDVVFAALKAADKGKSRSVCGIGNKCVAAIGPCMPKLAARIWRGQFH